MIFKLRQTNLKFCESFRFSSQYKWRNPPNKSVIWTMWKGESISRGELKPRSHQTTDQPPLSSALQKWTDRQWAGLDRGEHMLVWNTAGVGRTRSDRSWWAGQIKIFKPVEKWSGIIPLSTGRMLSGDTAWWSAVPRRLVIFWSGLVGATA